MKDKKQQRQQAAKLLKEHSRLIRTAEKEEQLLQHFPPFQSFNRNGLQLQLAYYTADNLPKHLHDWVYDLCKRNMYESYLPVWGWNERKKKRQFTEAASRFLIAFDGPPGQGIPQAFVNFRFDLEDDAPVLYCYEVQLEEAVQRKGLGKFIMLLLQLIAVRYRMQAVMLTVMVSNTAARTFYTALGYTLHSSSPGYEDPTDDTGYRIMFKDVREALARQQRAQQAAAAAAAAVGQGGGSNQAKGPGVGAAAAAGSAAAFQPAAAVQQRSVTASAGAAIGAAAKAVTAAV